MATVKFQLRRDTAANWASVNPTLGPGEPALETDAGKGKYGDGTTAWNSLPYSWVVLSAFGATMLADANETAARATLGLTIGSDVQAYDADLAAIAALSTNPFGRDILALADQAALRTYVGSPPSSDFASGTYTPTITGAANVSATVASQCIYSRVGNTITVSGAINVTATVAGVSTAVGISLPIASDLGAGADCSGCAFSAGVQQGAGIEADFTNNRAQMRYIAVDTGARGMFFTFAYQII